MGGGRIKYVDRPRTAGAAEPISVIVAPVVESVVAEKPKREPRKPQKHEAAALAFCRELRDRWVERLAEQPWLIEAAGKYEVAKLPAVAAERLRLTGPLRQLPAAA